MSFNTVDTTRIPFESAISMSVAVSQMQWPKPNMKKSPKAIILVPNEVFPYAFAATSLVHDPVLGNLLFTPVDALSSITCEEIGRLDPSGTEDIPPIIAIGPFSPIILQELESMGYPVLHIIGKDIFTTAVMVARLREQITPSSPDGSISLFVVSADTPYEGVLATYYSTHSGVPILFTHRNRLPQATARALHAMSDKHVYIIGGTRSVSDAVASEIGEIVEPPVHRIAGGNPFESAVLFSQYYDPTPKLGWNRIKKGMGDAFTFGNLNRWDLIVAASSMAHQGKHTPLLLIEDNCVPSVILHYLHCLKPAVHGMHPTPPFMHGFVLGTCNIIDYEVQSVIEEALKMDEQP